MKIKIVTAAVLSLLATTTFAVPTFYGEIDASVDYLPEKNATKSNKDVWEISSNSSFLGLKGEEKLTDRLSAVYAIEWGFSADGDSSDWTQRNRFVGLKDAQLGTLKIGKHDTPVKQLSSVVDTFNNYVANKADIGGIFTGENRIDNVLVYESPAVQLLDGAFKVNALLATGESSGIKATSGGAKVAGRGLGDAWSASVTYDNPLLVAGIGYDKAIPSNFLGRGFLNAAEPAITGGSLFAAANTVRAIGKVTPLEGLALKALYQSSEVEKAEGNAAGSENIDDAQGWLVGAEYNIPQAKNWTVKGQYSQNDTSFKNDTADFKAKQVIAGADYAFNKQVKTYGYAGYLTLEQASKKDKQPVAGLGLEFKF
ncbi:MULTISPECIES: porin [Acinetobacter]|uniref:porin n=1 Tax=Acinetobacter TaxID=469 RepID=UPI00044A3787|nr:MULTISPECIES: porin [Acinetobacter]EXB46468.1 gram-negative porin family protein [Acinetobacter baumannii 146457]EYT15252.1 gram-negative porin family protein [Acinetobacter sp. 1000160]MBJ8418973.1 porin [Acinetobacter courvalinii]